MNDFMLGMIGGMLITGIAIMVGEILGEYRRRRLDAWRRNMGRNGKP